LDVEAVLDDAVENSLVDKIVVVGFGRDIEGPGTESLATGAVAPVLCVVDIDVGLLVVGQGVQPAVQRADAASEGAAVRARVAHRVAADDTDSRHEHGLCSWDTG